MYHSFPVSPEALSSIAQLTALTELSVICRETIDDDHIRMLAALTNLVDLEVGPLFACSSQSLDYLLSGLTCVQRLSLVDAITMEDENVAKISSLLSATLQTLCIRNCPQLTNESMPYFCMPQLTSLFFSNNIFIDLRGIELLVSKSPALIDLGFRACAQLNVRDCMKMQQKLRIQRPCKWSQIAQMHSTFHDLAM